MKRACFDAIGIAMLCLVGWTGTAHGQGGAAPDPPATITISERNGDSDHDVVIPIHLIRSIRFDPCREIIASFHDGTERRISLLTHGVLTFVPCVKAKHGARGMPMAGIPTAPDETSAGLAVTLFPNPTSSTLAIEITSDRIDRASVAIYDMAGNTIWQREAVDLPAGISRVTWDGTNSAGTIVPTGTYVVRVTAPGRESTQYVNVMK